MTEARAVYCPRCGTRYSVEPALLEGAGLLVLCGACTGGFRVDELGRALEAQAAQVAATSDLVARVDAREGRAASAPHGAVQDALLPRVIVGHEVPSAQRSIATVLREQGFSPACVASGEQVLAACDAAMPALPDAVVLDVGVPGVMAFEVIEQLRRQPFTATTPIVLLASVFEKTRYKRRPNRLYGADAYLELHHVPDRLGELLKALLEKKEPPPERLQAPIERARAVGLRGSSGGDQSIVDEHVARMLARRLLSDVALYHGDEIAAGVRQQAPFAALGDAVEAARTMFVASVADPGGAAGPDVFDDELAAFTSRLLERTRRREPA